MCNFGILSKEFGWYSILQFICYFTSVKFLLIPNEMIIFFSIFHAVLVKNYSNEANTWRTVWEFALSVKIKKCRFSDSKLERTSYDDAEQKFSVYSCESWNISSNLVRCYAQNTFIRIISNWYYKMIRKWRI